MLFYMMQRYEKYLIYAITITYHTFYTVIWFNSAKVQPFPQITMSHFWTLTIGYWLWVIGIEWSGY